MNHPPRWLESLVSALLPPVSREHVLGDLSERYRSPGRYMAEALQALPGVIASQMRRAVQWPADLQAGYLLYFALRVDLGAGHDWLAAALPALAAVLALILRDLYRTPLSPARRTLWSQAVLDGAAVTAAILASQAALAVLGPVWMLPARALTFFLILLFVVLIFCHRLECQKNAGEVPSPWTAARSLSILELLAEARDFDRGNRRWLSSQRFLLVMVAVSCAASLIDVSLQFSSTPPLAATKLIVLALGAATCARGAAMAKRQLRQVPPLPDSLPEALGFSECLTIYSRRLEHSQRFRRTALWLLAPGFLGLGLQGASMGTAQPPEPWLANFQLVIFMFIVWESQIALGRLQHRLGQLGTVTEKAS